MPQYIQGQVAEDFFTLVDELGAFITGEPFVTGAAIDPDGEAFAVAVEEIGGGVYKIFFTASKVGSYYYRVDSTTLTPTQSYQETITIIPPEIFGVTQGPASHGNTLDDLFRATAIEVGDFLEVIATTTGASGGGSFPDELRLAAIPANSLKGAALYIKGPAINENVGREARILDSSSASQSLTLQPPLPYTVAEGTIGWITNLNARGFWRVQIINAINNAILKAKGHRVPVDYSGGDPFSAASPYIPRPEHMTTLYEVRAFNGDGMEYVIPQNDQNRYFDSGWYYDYSAKRIVIGDYWKNSIDGFTIRLLGSGRPSPLVNGDDYTTIDFGWIVETAAASLKRGRGEQKELAVASMFDNRADIAMSSTLTMYHPNEISLI